MLIRCARTHVSVNHVSSHTLHMFVHVCRGRGVLVHVCMCAGGVDVAHTLVHVSHAYTATYMTPETQRLPLSHN